jgi:hypothetical protein
MFVEEIQAGFVKPAPFGVLAGLQSRTPEVALNAYQEVLLNSVEPVVAAVGELADPSQYARHPPAGLLEDLPAQRTVDRLVLLDMPSYNVPAVRKQPAFGGSALDKDPSLVVEDQGARTAQRFIGHVSRHVRNDSPEGCQMKKKEKSSKSGRRDKKRSDLKDLDARKAAAVKGGDLSFKDASKMGY